MANNATHFPAIPVYGGTMAEDIRVLHVDDEPDFAAMAAEFLER